MTQTEFPGTIVAIGGPFAHRNTRKISATGVYDWIFDGEADWSFPIACQRWFRGDKTMDQQFRRSEYWRKSQSASLMIYFVFLQRL